jgi:regulator of RNase E activity RraA
MAGDKLDDKLGDKLDSQLLERLREFDTPTISNALELVAPERRGFGFTTAAMVCAVPGLKPMIGYARTATYRSATPSRQSPADQRDARARYYEYVAAGPHPTIAMIQDIDPEPGYGAMWGEVNTTVHLALGCAGCVTNGSIRDLDALAPGFQLLAGKIGPSHAFGHVVAFGDEVKVLGMAVNHGALIHADRHGAVIIPADAAPAIPDAIDLIIRREAVILEACREPGFDVEMLKRKMADSAEIH